MHRMIMQLSDPMVHVDHINGNPLDNRAKNLRVCTNSENAKNRGRAAINTTGYKGVFRTPSSNKWRAMIGVDGKQIHLGLFDSKIDAAKAYDAACIKLHGEFANHNNKLNIGETAPMPSRCAVPITNTSGYRGVIFQGNTWIASIGKGYKKIYLGSFGTAIEAAAAYNSAARKLFGDHAVLNNLPDDVVFKPKVKANNTTGFRGVHLSKSPGKYVASCKHVYIGVFTDKIAAARAYDVPTTVSFKNVYPQDIQDRVLANWTAYGYPQTK